MDNANVEIIKSSLTEQKELLLKASPLYKVDLPVTLSDEELALDAKIQEAIDNLNKRNPIKNLKLNCYGTLLRKLKDSSEKGMALPLLLKSRRLFREVDFEKLNTLDIKKSTNFYKLNAFKTFVPTGFDCVSSYYPINILTV